MYSNSEGTDETAHMRSIVGPTLFSYAKQPNDPGARWLSGVARDCGFEPHRRHCVVSMSN